MNVCMCVYIILHKSRSLCYTLIRIHVQETHICVCMKAAQLLVDSLCSGLIKERERGGGGRGRGRTIDKRIGKYFFLIDHRAKASNSSRKMYSMLISERFPREKQ